MKKSKARKRFGSRLGLLKYKTCNAVLPPFGPPWPKGTSRPACYPPRHKSTTTLSTLFLVPHQSPPSSIVGSIPAALKSEPATPWPSDTREQCHSGRGGSREPRTLALNSCERRRWRWRNSGAATRAASEAAATRLR